MPEVLRPLDTAAGPAVPRTYAGFRNLHAGETMLVCGLGGSLNLLAEPERFLTIGVNDIGRRFQPDYLLVLNSRPQFSRERFEHIAGSRAAALFSHLRLDVPHGNLIQLVLGAYGAPDFSRPERLAHTRNSPYVAVCLAVYMGARRIGLIGVDFTDNHFFGPTGRHSLAAHVGRMEAEYGGLARACGAVGVELVNLSPVSRITSVPRMDLGDFAGAAKSARSLNVVSYATTPVAGVPHVLTRCIAARTPHHAQTVWPRAGYGNGVEFGGGIETHRDRAAGRRALEAADVVILHNGFVAPADRALMDIKPTLTLAHNYKWNVDDRFVRRGAPGLVVAQYQAALPEFAGWTPVPQPMPLWEEAFRPEPKGETVTIAYTPSGRHESYPPGHRLHWHGKGYATTLAVLDRLARRHGVRIETIRGAQVSHAESLAMKRRAQIVIDECVTGSYHRNSLEGLAAGAVVVNGLGLVPSIADVVRGCLGLEAADDLPFVRASLATLEEVLEGLVAAGPEALAARGAAGRAWLERHWGFERQWADVWLPAIDRAMGHVPATPRPWPRAVPAPPTSVAAPAAQPMAPAPAVVEGWDGQGEVTVVVPHRGAERLHLLDACLARLRRVAGIAQVIVVELAAESLVGATAARHGAEHIFCRTDDAFEKGRALNIATPFAQGAFVLWLDNDFLLPPDFVIRAVREVRERGLDSLTPWFEQRYLSEPDSAAVRTEGRNEAACLPVRTVHAARGWCGGAELVRRAFLLEHGGVPPGFLGWGGEDNAWLLKARLLGAQATTRNPAQVAFHLFHPQSNGYAQGAAMQANAHYAGNLALLRRMRAVRGRAAFLRQFPPPAHHPAPWENVRRVACPAGSEAGLVLKRLFGPAVEIVAPDAPHDLALTALGAGLPEAVALAAARHLAGLAPAASAGGGETPGIGPMMHARRAHFALPEVRAVRRLGPLPRARAWELPFALQFARLPPGGCVVDRSADPVALDRLFALARPDVTCRSRPAGVDPASLRALEMPDGQADLVTCLNTLETLPEAHGGMLMQDMARLLKPGGRLVVTCDVYFDSFFRAGTYPFAGLRQVTPAEVGRLAALAGLVPLEPLPAQAVEEDRSLFRNIAPCPHALTGMVFRKPGGTEAPFLPLALALLPGPDGDARLAALRREAAALVRRGQSCVLLRPAGDGAELLAFERAVSLPPDGAERGWLEAARAAGAAALCIVASGRVVPPLMVRALADRLAGMSSEVTGLVWDGVCSPHDDLPVLGLRIGGEATGSGPLALLRTAMKESGLRLAVAIVL